VGQPRRSWGWHQLEPSWAERFVESVGICPGDLVLDIGAGNGALVSPLLDRGARVIAVERHPGRAASLSSRYGSQVIVVRADASDLRLPRRPFRVVANPPFAVTAPLLRRLLHPRSRLLDAHLVLQLQAARHWAGPTAPAAARWQRSYSAALGMPLPRSAFRPPPHVDCRVLSITRRR
jgi:23S rRNA (adenine-N6)-dimethyltransferase